MIRTATHSDVDGMLELMLRVKPNSIYAFVPFSKERARKTIRQCISGPQAYAKVAEFEGKIVALLLAVKDQMFFSERLEAKDIVFLCEKPQCSTPLLRDFLAWAWTDQRVANVLMAQSSGIEVARTTEWFQREGFELVGGVFYLNRWDVEGQKVAI